MARIGLIWPNDFWGKRGLQFFAEAEIMGAQYIGDTTVEALKHTIALRTFRKRSAAPAIPGATINSSTSRKLNVNRKYSQTQWLMISGGNQFR